MKAPSDSIIYWSVLQERTKECMIPMLDFNASALPNIRACNSTTAYASQTKDLIDDTHSLFHLELKVRHCNTSTVDMQMILWYSSVYMLILF